MRGSVSGWPGDHSGTHIPRFGNVQLISAVQGTRTQAVSRGYVTGSARTAASIIFPNQQM